MVRRHAENQCGLVARSATENRKRFLPPRLGSLAGFLRSFGRSFLASPRVGEAEDRELVVIKKVHVTSDAREDGKKESFAVEDPVRHRRSYT